jgi:hypothetical protein
MFLFPPLVSRLGASPVALTITPSLPHASACRAHLATDASLAALGRTPAALAESLPEPLGSQLRQLFERAQVIDRLALDAATRAAERTQRASLVVVHSHQVLADGTAGARGSGGMGADTFL